MALLEGVAAGAGGCCSGKGSKAMKKTIDIATINRQWVE